VTAEDGVVPAIRDELAEPVRPPVGDRAEQVAVVRGAGHDVVSVCRDGFGESDLAVFGIGEAA